MTMRIAFLVLLGSLLASCAAPGRPRLHDADYPGELQAPRRLGDDVLWQQRVTAIWGEGEQRGFDAAVQKQGDRLTVIGLSPVSGPGFVLVLEHGAVTLTNQAGMEVPFPPRFVILDVQRVFFPWLANATDSEWTSGEAFGERITEVRSAGRLVERKFERLDGKPAGAITVRYEWGDAAPTRRAPIRATLDNAWFGYRLVIDTHTEAALPPAGTGPQ